MKETVYIAERLETVPHGKDVAVRLRSILEDRLKLLPFTDKGEWPRDYMPIKNANGELVQFQYHPAYLNSAKGNATKPAIEKIHKELDIKPKPSGLILDGGAVELYGKKSIVSDRVFRDNHELHERDIYNTLKKELAVDQLIIVPQHPLDFTGHVDGMIRFVDEETVVINDLNPDKEEFQKLKKEKKNPTRQRTLENWYYSFKSILYNANLNIEILPSAVAEAEKDSHANGIYINFLNLNEIILMPIYEENDIFKENNEIARQKLRELYDQKVVGINCDELAKQGGMINCVTWQMT